VDVDEEDLDAGITLKSTGAGSKLAVLFNLPRRMTVKQVNLWLSRTGATVAGTLTASLYTTAAGLPSMLIGTSISVDIDGVGGAPQGRYARVQFPLSEDIELPAGTYAIVLTATTYVYGAGTSEVLLGVKLSGAVGNVCTYDGVTWTAYGVISDGIIEVVGCFPGWDKSSSSIASVEYPAASMSAGETPLYLDKSDYTIFYSEAGWWLYFPRHQPSITEKVRVTFGTAYSWIEDAADPLVSTPAGHFEAICCLAASISCDWLASRYGQNRDSSINADSVERRTQADQYLSLSKQFRKSYLSLSGQGSEAQNPGGTVVEMNTIAGDSRSFLFHRRTRL
jgi:hypothetical protein